MIDALRDLRDLLDGIERDGEDFDQGAMDAAISIVDRLILQHEPPLAISAVNSVYSVPTPFSPAAAAPPQQKKKARRPANQCPTLSRKKRKTA